MKRLSSIIFVLGSVFLPGQTARAQHLWWDLDGQKDATCLYGEITVLATARDIYYCGANWFPGKPAGGYCGIQHNSETERRTIFSIWDTSHDLHPHVTAAHPQTIHNRFGGEGDGQHTHMIYQWNVGETFQFFLKKQPGKGKTTDTFYFIYDRASKRWIHSATINNPNGSEPNSVMKIGGGLNSFLENFGGKEFSLPKLAIYRLWVGPNVDEMKCLTKAIGDGKWGKLNDAYFLAEGDPEALDRIFAELKKKFGEPEMGRERATLRDRISDRPIPKRTTQILRKFERQIEKGVLKMNSQ